MKHNCPPAYSFGSKTPAEPKLTPMFNPGPGTYEVRKDEDLKVPTSVIGTGNRDFLKGRSNVPGPGAYEIKHFVEKRESKSEDNRRHQSAHSKRSLKDRMSNAKLVFPGPGTYNPQKLTTKAAFSMGNRTYALQKGNSENVPGPGTYEPSLDINRPNSRVTRVGTSQRQGIAPGTKNNIPGPGAYSPSPTHVKESIPKFSFSKGPRRNAQTAQDIRDYNPSDGRTGLAKTIIPRRPLTGSKNDFPGPGAYQPKDMNPGPGFSVGNGGRSNFIRAKDTPGPAEYHGDYPPPKTAWTFGKGKRPPITSPKNYEDLKKVEKFEQTVQQREMKEEQLEKIKQKAPKPGYTIVGRKAEGAALFEKPGPGAHDPDVSPTHEKGPAYGIGTGLRSTESIGRPKVHPGPGQYDVRGKVPGPKWGFGSDQRTRTNMDDEPGPGAYDIPATVPEAPKYLMVPKRASSSK